MFTHRNVDDRPTVATWLELAARLLLWVLAALTVAVVAYASAVLFRA